jgi:hypothetical protein
MRYFLSSLLSSGGGAGGEGLVELDKIVASALEKWLVRRLRQVVNAARELAAVENAAVMAMGASSSLGSFMGLSSSIGSFIGGSTSSRGSFIDKSFTVGSSTGLSVKQSATSSLAQAKADSPTDAGGADEGERGDGLGEEATQPRRRTRRGLTRQCGCRP